MLLPAQILNASSQQLRGFTVHHFHQRQLPAPPQIRDVNRRWKALLALQWSVLFRNQEFSILYYPARVCFAEFTFMLLPGLDRHLLLLLPELGALGSCCLSVGMSC